MICLTKIHENVWKYTYSWLPLFSNNRSYSTNLIYFCQKRQICCLALLMKRYLIQKQKLSEGNIFCIVFWLISFFFIYSFTLFACINVRVKFRKNFVVRILFTKSLMLMFCSVCCISEMEVGVFRKLFRNLLFQ